MKITGAKTLEDVEPKSRQEIEEALIKAQEDKNTVDNEPKGDESNTDKKDSIREFTDDDVLTHLKNKYGRDVKSVDDLFTVKDTDLDLPEDIKSFRDYKKETGRGMEDFVKLNRDYSKIPEEKLLRDYYKHTEEGLDDEDIADLIESKYSYDEDLDDESEIKSKKLAQKREINKAKKYFEEQKEKYRAKAL